MNQPWRLVFRGTTPPRKLETRIHEQVQRLGSGLPGTAGGRLIVESAGDAYTVHLHVRVRGRELTARHTDDDLLAAVGGAFRQLSEPSRRRGGGPCGRVVELFPESGYGFVLTPEGAEVYFHRHSVLHDSFDELEVGSEVRFRLEQGEDGPQATSLQLERRRNS